MFAFPWSEVDNAQLFRPCCIVLIIIALKIADPTNRFGGYLFFCLGVGYKLAMAPMKLLQEKRELYMMLFSSARLHMHQLAFRGGQIGSE